MNCPICDRPLSNADKHHLIPKCKKGSDTVEIHKVCHRKIHSLWTENELRDYYHTVERIREHPDMEKFIKWLKKKPDDYYTGTKDSNTRKFKRRR